VAAFALVPLFWVWRGATPGAAAATGFVFGIGYLGPLMWGLHHVGYFGYVTLAVAASIYFAATGALVALFGRHGMRSPLLTAAIWTVLEALRGQWPLGGLAWGEVGNAFHDIPTVRSLASWGGVALVSFVVVAWNGYLLDLLLAPAGLRQPRRRALVGLAVIAVVTVGADIGRIRTRETGDVRFAMLQAWVDEHAPTTSASAEARATTAHLALAEELDGRYDLIVFPESAMAQDPEVDPALRQALVTVANRHDAVVLANARHREDGALFNANLVYDPDGRLQGTYAKQHLVPFGEFVPLRDELSFIGDLRQIPYDFTAGTTYRLFDVGAHPMGTVICYESAYPRLVREFVRKGAELLVVSTSDRSYGRSGIAAAHFAVAQMRAAETGRPVLQAAISGVSGVIDADGDARDESELFETTLTEGRVITRSGDTPYVRFGDWVLAVCGLGLIVAAIAGVRRRARAF
jgi:apolipoprotein N-acyltransferase